MVTKFQRSTLDKLSAFGNSLKYTWGRCAYMLLKREIVQELVGTHVPRISLNSNIFLMSSTCFFHEHFPESPFSRAMVQPGKAADASNCFGFPGEEYASCLFSHALDYTPLWRAQPRASKSPRGRWCSLAGSRRWKCHRHFGSPRTPLSLSLSHSISRHQVGPRDFTVTLV